MSWLSDAVKRNIPPDLNPFDNLAEDVKKAITDAAENAATSYQSEKPNGDFDDCVIIASAAAAAAGAAIGGIAGAAVGAGTGLPAARIACRRIFPE
ncbi:hypothetical protein [Bacillus paramycoides]|uniref:hypothetical protein n=1 Tax=Bacillus paramycoides TaxID=2026194 RepID=UPI002E1E4D11|nr:hypothetical protein [Bacillus paramycoides]